jgi:alpha-1,3-mannosyl-glycoprotein beta-1,2-N-acetylglucosaminyltransferase
VVKVFPGLGWLLTRSVGLELMSTWPPGYWDDNHLRKPHIRKGRQCVYPEVPRTHTFGAVGASNGMFYLEHLDNMVANTEVMDWQEQVGVLWAQLLAS